MMPDLPGFDVENALHRMAGSVKLYTKILKQFSEGYADFGQQVKDFINQENLTAAQEHAHTIKGISGNIGATDLFNASSELESVLRHGPKEKLEAAANDFSKRLQEAMDVLSKAFPPETTPEPAGGSKSAAPKLSQEKEKLKADLERLKKLLGEYDIESADAFEVLAGRLRNFSPGDSDSLFTAIDAFDYDSAVEIVNKILKKFA